ncbi:hypothetical protein C6N75_01245 [Streptomyces solincola]|uniref:C2H2-type domain-containing protein n=1 Tax=Streptomyces solincola TaxID=2100817 RepID=A0A2S9Q2Z1_9ACTN|nr:hypothetical protein [Streptomyces solincola]PRH80977.1 hypothetical protein C6N75_01245 [Streptomyces solincola]
MTEIASTPVGHEAYAFACLKCGHGWEQAYDIEHHTDVSGHEFVVYRADGGRRVASPLSQPACDNCGSHVVRIMRSGQVSSVLDLLARQAAVPAAGPLPAVYPSAASAPEPAASEPAAAVDAAPTGRRKEPHHWHLSDLLHAFHRK